MQNQHQFIGFDMILKPQSLDKSDSKDGKDGKEGKDDGCSGNWIIFKGHQVIS